MNDPVDVHDLHATILHTLGVDHTKLTFKYQGRHFRLTDIHGNAVKSSRFWDDERANRESSLPFL